MVVCSLHELLLPQILCPLLRQQMQFIADWPAFGITDEEAGFLAQSLRGSGIQTP
jgi:hypothetical protein